MCRMIIALGEIKTKELIEDLILIAQGKNEINEKNSFYGKIKHSDGWGIAYLNKNNIWETYKSLRPIYKDERINQLKDIETKAMVLHVRKATVGKRTLENTQPLHYRNNEGDFVFVHNGTIKERFKNLKTKKVKGNSDTVMWFNKLLCDINANQEKNNPNQIYCFNRFTSANFFLVTPKKIIVGQYFKNNPNYHTMKIMKDKHSFIISSEILPTFKNHEWKKIHNKTLIEIDHNKIPIKN